MNAWKALAFAFDSPDKPPDSGVWPFLTVDLTDLPRPAETYVCTLLGDMSDVQVHLVKAGYRREWFGPAHYILDTTDEIVCERRVFVRNRCWVSSGVDRERLVVFRASDCNGYHVHRYCFRSGLRATYNNRDWVECENQNGVQEICEVESESCFVDDYPRYACIGCKTADLARKVKV